MFARIANQWREARQSKSRLASIRLFTVLALDLIFINRPKDVHLNDHGIAYWMPQLGQQRLQLLDPIRWLIQVGWLAFIYQPPESSARPSPSQVKRRTQWFGYFSGSVNRILTIAATPLRPLVRSERRANIGLLAMGLAILAFVLTLPMDAAQQGLLLLIFWGIALWVRKQAGQFPMIVMMLLSFFVSTRYIYWRITETINWSHPLDGTLGFILLSAEVYAWVILLFGYMQTVWPLKRKIAQLPDNLDEWPTVDIYIPTYNEPLAVVKPTIMAAQAIEWPADKLNVYLLDDGRRSEYKQFCEQLGVGYIVRPNGVHAKAGNLNHALTKTSGDYIAIFDCDHVPTRGFLQMTMGWFFKDPKLALVQTPHHFFSPDPFERNLSIFRNRPNEGELFYGLIQDGNDMWNASFFCGSCAVLKRQPLEEVGGIAVETVTEDAHTALKMHRRGYQTAYLNIPLAAGLATESLADHIGQRMRWARGMAQIFRLDNPLLGKGLNWAQRLCYSNAMLYFLNGGPRLIFLTAPLAFLLLGSYIVYAPAVMIAVYALPHIIHANLTNSRKQGQYRHSFWAEMYETVLAWYILKPTTVALFAPHKGKFNVTSKGQRVDKNYFNWQISTPYIVLVLISLLGFIFGVYKFFTIEDDQQLTVIINMVWLTYNLIILGGAVAVAEEAKQQRSAHRVAVDIPIHVITESEHSFSARMVDFSAQGVGITLPSRQLLRPGQSIYLNIQQATSRRALRAEVISCRDDVAGVELKFANAEEEQAFVMATFGRLDAWLGWRPQQDEQPLASLREVVGYGLTGYQRIAAQIAPYLLPFFKHLNWIWQKLSTFLPIYPGKARKS
ncbi:UDP-forming cellulose synthase catalytic subunit [Idiomarina sp. MD25a]|uniref:UDP-forming cellulose synthase catalytic subunit n=1 Tax=Idiomarina sp. MD25a TaxID=1889913 RepID=UPI0009F5FF45|nr:UDP-forming cellulose synthase catalytic subunit [Idiomarina sp. MD25a]